MRAIATSAVALISGLGLLSMVPAGAAGTADESPPAARGAVQVTADPNPTRAHSSPQMGRDPTNGDLVIVEAEVRHDFACGVHLSTDGGQSWFAGGDPTIEPWTECARKPINGPYATVAFDPDGVLYLAFYASDPQFAQAEDLPIHIFLARSEDGGRSFETNFVFRAPEPVVEDAGLDNNDRPMVAVDQENPDNVYVSWMGRGGEGQKVTRAEVAASRDGGRTFAEPVDVSDERGAYQARPAVDPDGTVHVIYPIGLDARPEGVESSDVVRTLFHRRSTDQGQTWSEPVEVDQGNAAFYAGRKYVLAADQSDGTIYAVWYGSAEAIFDPSTDNVDIFVRSSTDGGETWSDRVTVNDDTDRDLVQHYDPGVSIAPDGRVDIAWYDFRNSPYPERFPEEFAAPFNQGGYQDVYYSWSTDGGRTFAPNVRVTDRIINREIGVWSNNVHSHMNVGIASSDDAAYFAWQDSRNGNDRNQAEDVYAASVVHDPDGAGTSDTPSWALPVVAVAGLALGAGLALLAVSWFGPGHRARRGQGAEQARA